MMATGRSPLLGREAELGCLAEALARVEDGAGVLAVVAGEAGSGKSRLLEEFRGRHLDIRFAQGECVNTEHGMPYAPWTELLDSLGHDLDGEREPGGKAAWFATVADVIARAATKPLVCVIEDVHWIDPASSDLLIAVVQRLRRMPVLLVLTVRNDTTSAVQTDLFANLPRDAVRIDLDALSEESARDIAAAVGGGVRDSEIVDRIIERAAGNPLFIEELASAPDPCLPRSLRDLLIARVNAISADSRTLVQTAAVIGVRVPRTWLIAASGLGEERGRVAARESVNGGVLVAEPDGRGYAFRHALLRDAILDHLVPDEKVPLHRSAAAALAAHPELTAELNFDAELARHWDAAEDAPEALVATLRAAGHASHQYAYETAAELYERAQFWWRAVPDATERTGIDHLELLLATADAAGDSARYEAAADIARRALDEAADISPVECVRVFPRARRHLWGAQRSHELLEFASMARARLDQVDVAARANFLEAYIDFLVFDGRPGAAFEVASEAIAAANEVGDPAVLSDLHQVLSLGYEMVGDIDGARREGVAAIEIAREHDLYTPLTLVTYNYASTLSSYPAPDEVFAVLDDCEQVIEQHGLMRFRVAARTLRAAQHCYLGNLGEAAAVLATLDEATLDGVGLFTWRCTRALIALHEGRHGDVLEELAPNFEGARADPARFADQATTAGFARSWLGDFGPARDLVGDAIAALNGRCEPYWHGFLVLAGLHVEAAAATAATNDDERQLAAERADAIARSWDEILAQQQGVFPLVAACTEGVNAELARITGDDRIETAQRAAEAFDAIAMPYFAVYFAWRTAEAQLVAGDRAAATSVLAVARTRAAQHGYAALVEGINQTARQSQLKLGPGRTDVDGERTLSVRELEVVRLLGEGKSNPQIAAELFITARTAKAHVANIMEKLGAASRTEAVVIAQRRGII